MSIEKDGGKRDARLNKMLFGSPSNASFFQQILGNRLLRVFLQDLVCQCNFAKEVEMDPMMHNHLHECVDIQPLGFVFVQIFTLRPRIPKL